MRSDSDQVVRDRVVPETPVREVPLHDRVYTQLRRRLMTGHYEPGQQMSLRTLAAEFGTSPMPVRAAMSRLIAERGLIALPSRHVVVPRLTPRSLQELTQIREHLEGAAAEMACHFSSLELVACLSRINSDLHQTIADDDTLGSLQNNLQFHFKLYGASGSDILPPLIEALWLQVGPAMRVSMMSPRARWDASRHDAALIALQRRDPKALREAIESDVRQTTFSASPD
jgi:DNA-binding GntR family transcriptional regulator